MTPRFRVVAGPNGSGKTTLMRRLAADYAVNFYDTINADDIFAEVSKTGAYAPAFPVEGEELAAFAAKSEYPADVKESFSSGAVSAAGGIVRFAPCAATSYTVALLAEFLQAESIAARRSFSRETVFSHPSKLQALEAARKAGYRTYLYFVATDLPELNVERVANRERLGGHSVPPEKIASRFWRSLENASAAVPFLSRAFFFDNSGAEMAYLGAWSAENGFSPASGIASGAKPRWFVNVAKAFGGAVSPSAPAEAAALSASAGAASREAVAEAFAAGLTVPVVRDGRVVRISSGSENGGVPPFRFSGEFERLKRELEAEK